MTCTNKKYIFLLTTTLTISGNGFENFFQFPKPHRTLDAQFIENLEFPFALQHLNHRRDRAVSIIG